MRPLCIEAPEQFAPIGGALAALGIGVTLVDRSMKVCWANELVREQAAELSCAGATHCFKALWDKARRCPDCLPLLVFSTGEPQEGLRERGREGGTLEAYRVRAVPVYDAARELRWVAECFVRLTGLAPEVGGRRGHLAAESADARGAAFLVVDGQERIVSWGPAAAAMFGYALEEALGRRVELLVPEDRLGEEGEIALWVAQHGRFPRTETVRRAKDGRAVPVALSAVALFDEAGRRIGRSCILEDLSALQQLRSRVATQEQLLAHISREAAEPILGVDPEGRLTSWNHAAERLLGMAASEALGRPLAELAGEGAAGALLEQVARERSVRGLRMAWRGARGDPVQVEVSAALLAGVGGGGVALVARDLSAQLEFERQLMRSEKLAVVGSLAAGLAHEIGTPLNVISATAEFLMPEVGEAQAGRLSEIVAETDRISRLVRELLSFARGSGAGRAPVPLPQAVERVVSLLRIPVDRKRVRVEVDLPEALPPVVADHDGLHQVLLNLIVNAVNAVAEGGRVAVSARPGAAARTVALAIDDDGPGVPEALRKRIFDPFFTTRAEGTGLGLAVCERVVSSLGGDVAVGTSPLGGARFTVQLPAATEEAP